MPTTIISIGYEGRTPDELVALLLAYHVERVIDVRELPLSRRKGFSKTALAEHLRCAGIEYRHLRVAGNPHRRAARNAQACLAMFDQYLRAHPEVLDAVADESYGRRAAVLCYERTHEACHRSRLLCGLKRRRSQRRLRIVQVE